jgi:hypothetical protein
VHLSGCAHVFSLSVSVSGNIKKMFSVSATVLFSFFCFLQFVSETRSQTPSAESKTVFAVFENRKNCFGNSNQRGPFSYVLISFFFFFFV